MLLSHTSSIRDSSQLYAHTVCGRDSPIPLDQFIRGYLQPGGAYYLPANWSRKPPGTFYQYSNAGTDTAGDLVERIAGTDLQTYSQEHMFSPLGMTESSWFFTGLDRAHIAMPYRTDRQGDYIAVDHCNYPGYPDGLLRTSGLQLARFLMMVIGRGSLDGAQLLMDTTVGEMLAPQPNSYEGLSWQYTTIDGHDVIGHGGVDLGVSTDMWFEPTTGAGYILLSNGNVYYKHFASLNSGDYVRPVQAMVDVGAALLDYAAGP